VLPDQFNFLWEHYLQGQHLLKKQGHGWNPTNVAEYFQVSSFDEDNGEK